MPPLGGGNDNGYMGASVTYRLTVGCRQQLTTDLIWNRQGGGAGPAAPARPFRIHPRTTPRGAHVTAKHLTTTKAGKALLSLVVLTLLAVALQSLGFSDASFTAGSANPANVFAAGTLSHTNSKAGQVVLDASYLRPGVSKNGSLAITGSGTLTGTYTLSKASLVDTPSASGLSNTLTLTVQDVTSGATTLYSGTVAGFTSCALGSIAPGATRTYRFTVLYPAAGANAALEGATMALRLTFTGVTP